MIQRIQSLYMFLTTLLSLLFLKGSFLNFIDKSGFVIKIAFRGIYKNTAGQSFELIEKLLPLSVIIILIPVLAIVTILLFKHRKIQSWFSLSLIVLVIGFIIASTHCSYLIIRKYGAEIIPGVKMVLPVLILIFAILAYKGIIKDDRLIKSYDRLR